ncbi:hypothetical protein MMH89_02095 [Candidatus Comchoanobacter bicostacola]|uniref:Cyclodipeptide synthase n=1 Tax=Candidatus Comchoanobacter bicostacola TaxID=2919598 RepID=A0ABY5DMI8_9GAMM|nr:hypothetical protein [Candidatus Comchoanobacter bicostacola]UTC24939.1 hypothetical protein MMH89_02095 [Candidatus Comchoanobacter bicostacola]
MGYSVESSEEGAVERSSDQTLSLPCHYKISMNVLYSGGYEEEQISNMPLTLYTSFANPYFYGNRLYALLQFLSKRDNPVVIVTPGHLYRHVYMAQNNTSEEKGYEIALNKQKSYMEEELLPCLENFPGLNVRLVNWIDYYKRESFQEILGQFYAAYEKKGGFSKEIDQSVMSFLRVGKGERSEGQCEKDFNCSINFILEECAFLSYAVLNGHPAMIYPGRVFVDMDKLAQLDGCPPLFLKMVYLSADFKRKGRRRRI